MCAYTCPSLPCPSWALVRASLAVPKPSSLQTTLAAGTSHRWSHTVPHLPSRSNSTRPSPRRGPAFSRTTGCVEKKEFGWETVYELIWTSCHFETCVDRLATKTTFANTNRNRNTSKCFFQNLKLAFLLCSLSSFTLTDTAGGAGALP